jgi:4-amino-4-deoxy-L-arabinose transferase-like glycosyltransferase
VTSLRRGWMLVLARPALWPALCVLLYIVLATAFLERWPVPDFDEGLYANPALNLVRKGNFGSSAMSGVFDMGRVTFWFFPLHPLLLWVPIKLFGFSLWAVRLVSVVCGAFALLAMYRLARSLGFADKAAPLLLLFMGTDFMFLVITRRSRMEALLCLLYVTVLFLLVRAEQSGRRWAYFLPGLLTGAALMTHPLGGMAIPAFMLFSWPASSPPQRARAVSIWLGRLGTYTLGATLACLPFLFFVVYEGPREFWQQMVVYQAQYCYGMQGFAGGPLDNAARVVKIWFATHSWPFFLVKLLVLGGLAWPLRAARKLWALTLINLVLLFLAWPAGSYWEYWVPTFYPTLVVCAAGGFSNILDRPVGRFAESRRIVAGLAFAGVVVLNLAAVSHALYRNQRNAVSQGLAEVRKAAIGNVQEKPRVMGSTAFLFAFPEEDFRSVLVMRSMMDLQNTRWDRALLEIAPDVLLVDDLVRSGKWPAFELPPGMLADFLSRYGTRHGTVRVGVGGPQNWVQVYRLDLTALARDSAARDALSRREGSPP